MFSRIEHLRDYISSYIPSFVSATGKLIMQKIAEISALPTENSRAPNPAMSPVMSKDQLIEKTKLENASRNLEVDFALNYKDAGYYLGLKYEAGIGGVEVDLRKACDYYEAALESGCDMGFTHVITALQEAAIHYPHVNLVIIDFYRSRQDWQSLNDFSQSLISNTVNLEEKVFYRAYVKSNEFLRRASSSNKEFEIRRLLAQAEINFCNNAIPAFISNLKIAFSYAEELELVILQKIILSKMFNLGNEDEISPAFILEVMISMLISLARAFKRANNRKVADIYYEAAMGHALLRMEELKETYFNVTLEYAQFLKQNNEQLRKGEKLLKKLERKGSIAAKLELVKNAMQSGEKSLQTIKQNFKQIIAGMIESDNDNLLDSVIVILLGFRSKHPKTAKILLDSIIKSHLMKRKSATVTALAYDYLSAKNEEDNRLAQAVLYPKQQSQEDEENKKEAVNQTNVEATQAAVTLKQAPTVSLFKPKSFHIKEDKTPLTEGIELQPRGPTV